MSFPRYPTYKPSGVEWLGEVPEHWASRRLGFFFAERREKVSDKDFQALSVTKDGIVPQLDTAAKTDDGDNRKCVRTGDFVINSRSDRKGSSGLSRLDGSVSLICTVLRPQESVQGEFIHHLLRSVSFQEEFYRFGKGIVADLWSTNYSAMSGITLAMPPLEEQESIATFLDHETAKIDALIAEQQRLIELLQEKRQAVISHAVTKGLNPDAPMKDSGVEWLGEVPEHWETGKIKHYFRTTSGSTPNSDKPELYYTTEEDDQGTPWIRTTDIDDGEVKAAAVFITPKALGDTACKPLPVNTVLVALYGGGGTVGKNGILKIEAAVNQALCGILPSPKALPEYVHRYIQFLRPFWMERAVSARKAGNISQELVGDTIFPVPPLKEQTAILRSIKEKLEELDELAGQSSASLGLLEERRSALISAAVTGQIDVHGLVPVAEAA